MSSLNVIIVNYFKAARLAEGLQSLRRQKVAGRLNICVLDNSCDAAQAALLQAAVQEAGGQLVVTDANLGYTAGVNLAASRMAAPDGDIVLMSPDIVLEDPGVLETLLAMKQAQPGMAVLAPMQRDDDGSVTEIARNFPNPFAQAARRLGSDHHDELSLLDPLVRAEGELDVDWIQSSFVLIDRGFWDAERGLPERYRIFMADIDFCLSAWRAGRRVTVTSRCWVRADGVRASGGGLRKLLSSRVGRMHIRDALVYYGGHGIFPATRKPRMTALRGQAR